MGERLRATTAAAGPDDDEDEVEFVGERTLEQRDADGYRAAIDLDATEVDPPVAVKRERPDPTPGCGATAGTGDGLVEFMHAHRLFCPYRDGALGHVPNTDMHRYIKDVAMTDVGTMVDLWFGSQDAATRRLEEARCRVAGIPRIRFARVWSFGRKIATAGLTRDQFDRFLS